jgi:hypothetical protein
LPDDQAAAPRREHSPLRPHISLTPEACGEVLRALQRGMEVFQRWGVVLPRGSWLGEAITRLEHVSESGSIGQTDDDLRYTSAAVAWAVDLYHISTCLGGEPSRLVAVELGKITHGRLLARGGASVAKSYLSQFWVGALLAQSKLKPSILAYEVAGRAKPDYLIECGRVKFAVEVKRPGNRDAVTRNVHLAGDQIRQFDRPGIIVIDATDCTSVDPWGVTRQGSTVRATVALELDVIHNRLARLIETYSRSNKFHQVVMLLTFARYWPWVIADRTNRDAGLAFRATAFRYRWSNQITPLTRVIQERLLRGVEQLTGNPPSYVFS